MLPITAPADPKVAPEPTMMFDAAKQARAGQADQATVLDLDGGEAIVARDADDAGLQVEGLRNR
ncbi:hypothetical protein [Caulobacter sp. B11]|uniref:hypothetical protein n=1 Tax=Caulobacter sp. B11 TaxID=2048899 RepID=UPI00137474D1|nr:hypothetical protein [Caulobacter sp. B11]